MKIPFAAFLLRIGLAIVFLYAAISSFFDPGAWVGFLPSWFGSRETLLVILSIFSTYQIVLAVWLISEYKPYYAALFASGTMLLIIVQNLTGLDIIFRDFAILFMAVALAVLTTPDKHTA